MKDLINENGLGSFKLTNLTNEEMKKIKAVEDEINKNHHGGQVSLMALDIDKTLE